jgi:hypothetical protein
MINLITMERYNEFIKKYRRLVGLKEVKQKKYLVKVTFYFGLIKENLNEHLVYKNFQNSTNRYTYHPEQTNPPVLAHYHIYPEKSKDELYAVNVVDGKAHHKKNRGHVVPKKEADELRRMGVQLPLNNILENLTYYELEQREIINESVKFENYIYLLIE